MLKLKYSSLVFVSRSKAKYHEYANLLGIADLGLSEIAIREPQSMHLDVLVEEKINTIKPLLPTNTPFFVEHTALTINAWNGLPGGLTGVFMDTVGNQGICRMMRAYKGEERVARAKVVIGFFHQSIGSHTFHGEVTGSIPTKPRGEYNFGWDPIFIPDGADERTFAEMSLPEKNKYSMRKEAVDKFQKFLTQFFEF